MGTKWPGIPEFRQCFVGYVFNKHIQKRDVNRGHEPLRRAGAPRPQHVTRYECVEGTAALPPPWGLLRPETGRVPVSACPGGTIENSPAFRMCLARSIPCALWPGSAGIPAGVLLSVGLRDVNKVRAGTDAGAPGCRTCAIRR